jgi:hypothetical protein
VAALIGRGAFNGATQAKYARVHNHLNVEPGPILNATIELIDGYRIRPKVIAK